MIDGITLLTSSVIAALISGIINLISVRITSSYPLKIEDSKQRYDLLKYRRELILEAYHEYCEEKTKFDDNIRSLNALELIQKTGDPGSQFFILIAEHFNLIKTRCLKYLVVFSDEHSSTIETALREISDSYDKMLEGSMSLSDSAEDIQRKGTLVIQYVTSMANFDKLYCDVLKNEMKACFTNADKLHT